MKNSEIVQNFWQAFCEISGENPETSFQVWHFGNNPEMADELLQLVLDSKKTATASLAWEYENKPDDAPVVGGYSIVTDFDGNPRCVVRTTELRVLPFNEVDEKFAFDEGEGDQSLDYWREVHWDYFAKICIEVGKEPSTEMLVNCERFELLYTKAGY